MTSLKRFALRHMPHYAANGTTLLLPLWWTMIFGGQWDTSNGYAWRPPIWWLAYRYYHENWGSAGYTLWGFVAPTLANHGKYQSVPKHGLWGYGKTVFFSYTPTLN